MTALVGKLSAPITVNLIVRLPRAFGLRVRVAHILCHLASAVLGGKLSVELEPEVGDLTPA